MLGVPLHCFHSSIGPEGSAFKDAANLRLIRHASLAQVGFKYRPAFLALDSLREPVRAALLLLALELRFTEILLQEPLDLFAHIDAFFHFPVLERPAHKFVSRYTKPNPAHAHRHSNFWWCDTDVLTTTSNTRNTRLIELLA